MAFLVVALLLIARPALADQPAPAPVVEYVDTEILKARAEALRDAVADHAVTDSTVKSRAHGFFDKLPEERLVIAPHYRFMERETVAGKSGTIDGMQEAAEKRLEEWKKAHVEPPPPEIELVVARGRSLAADKRIDYDTKGELAANQMGIFRYMRETIGGGLVSLNERMKMLASLVGEAFAYSTPAHELTHFGDHEKGALKPEEEIAGEIRAFRVQYLWLKMIDPSGERMLTLHGSLKMRMLREQDLKVKEALNCAVVYLEHLSDVVATNGKEDELRELVKKLGYSDDHGHDASKGRDAARPTSA